MPIPVERKEPEPEFISGSQSVIHALEEDLSSSNPPDTILVNMGTLLRNANIDSVSKSEQLEEAASRDANEIRQVVLNAPGDSLRVLCFYMSDYKRMFSKEHIRPVNRSDALIWASMLKAYSRISSTDERTDNTLIMVRRSPRKMLSFQHLQGIIKTCGATRKVCMVSHLPIDYHAHVACSNFTLLRSFTGERVGAEKLHNVVFKADVPFYKCTHAVLGDSKLILPSAMRTEKKKLIALSEEEQWLAKTESFVKDSLKKNGFLIKGQKYPIIGKV